MGALLVFLYSVFCFLQIFLCFKSHSSSCFVQEAISSDTQADELGISKAKFITLDLLTAQRLQVKAVIDSHPLWLVESEICVTYMTIKLYLQVDESVNTNNGYQHTFISKNVLNGLGMYLASFYYCCFKPQSLLGLGDVFFL